MSLDAVVDRNYFGFLKNPTRFVEKCRSISVHRFLSDIITVAQININPDVHRIARATPIAGTERPRLKADLNLKL